MTRLALPLSWEALERPPSVEDCERTVWANAAVLGFLLHGVDLDAAQRPGDERLTEALAPLRIKLDIIIEMLGRLTYRDVVAPPVREVEFGLDRLAWQSPQPLRAGDWLCIRLYFDARFLEPIVLYGCVASAVGQTGTGMCNVEADLIEVPHETGEAFARLAFLAQRRQLAQRPAGRI
ncbi:MAG TPA: hypothetical protein VMB84_00710 [Stellaceae bacterium]|nr:hypothetical protein [Stellaceae bacterium]